MRNKHASRGFTLIELLAVIVIIGILVLIVLAKVQRATREAKDATLVSNLKRIRTAVIQFNADTNVNPASLSDLVAPASDPPTQGAGGAAISAGTYRGPYLNTAGGIGGTGIPINPFIDSSETDITEHWTYTPATGELVVAFPEGTTLDGTDYQDL